MLDPFIPLRKAVMQRLDPFTEEMQKLCIEKLKEMGFPRPIGWLFTRNIPKLERWKNKG